jgi:hypothetical protein
MLALTFPVFVMTAYRSSICTGTLILNFDMTWRVSSFTLRSLYIEEVMRGTHRVGGWVGPRGDLQVLKRENYFVAAGKQTASSPAQSVASIQIMLTRPL